LIIMSSTRSTGQAGGLLKRARREVGLSQRSLADRTGIDQAVIARIEAGTTSPRFVTLTRLLAATGHRLELFAEGPADADTGTIRAAMAMTDRERERWFLESNANMLAMFAEAEPV
jgi:transcriptional regulator with XRE-family HTH domain